MKWWGLGVLIVAAVAIVLSMLLTGGDDDPVIPPSAVAVIEHAPTGMGEISKLALDRQLVLTAAEKGLDPPEPGERRLYEEIQNAAIAKLIKDVWIVAQAEELGFVMSGQELAAKVMEVKAEKDESEAEFKEGLRLKGYTQADFEDSVKREALNEKIEDWLQQHLPAPSQDEIEARYDEYGESFKSQPEHVNINILRSEDRDRLAQAKAELEKDDSPAAWETVIKRFSENARDDGGHQSVGKGEMEELLVEAVFSAPEAQLEGPIKTSQGFVVFERTGRSLPVKLPSLESMEGEIRRGLKAAVADKFIAEFGADYNDRWRSRTFCAPAYLVDLCSNSAVSDK